MKKTVALPGDEVCCLCSTGRPHKGLPGGRAGSDRPARLARADRPASRRRSDRGKGADVKRPQKEGVA